MSPFFYKTRKPSPESELILKYNLPVPRYTSYPTALKFCVIDDRESGTAVCDDRENEGPLSLYFHLPFCKSLCWFCGCMKIISTDEKVADTYLNNLEKEIRLIRPNLRSGRKAVQLHFGGGSPSFLTPAQTERLADMIHSNFAFEPHAEMSVEIDPRTLTREKVEAFKHLGINRASIGVQDVNARVQKAIHRVQPTEVNLQTIAWLKDAGINKLNVDLIYGLPYQTVKSFGNTLDEVLKYDPDRFALFSYAHVPWSVPSQKILERSPLPSPGEKIEMLCLAVKRFKEAGYVHIGMDHFTKPDDPLAQAQAAKTLQRNFQGYSLHKHAQICGFGISAISQSKRTYRQNTKILETYYQQLNAGTLPVERGYVLNADDQIRREVIMRIMCDMELEFDKIGGELNIDFKQYFRSEIESLYDLEQDGLLQLHADKLEVLTLGRLLVRNIAARFDAYYGKANSGYSKAI